MFPLSILITLWSCLLFFSAYGDHRDLHSFPTRRSSDLLTRIATLVGYTKAPKATFMLRHPIRGSQTLLADRKSTRLNSSHVKISYAVFCLKKKKKQTRPKHDVRRNNTHPSSVQTRPRLD